MRKDKEKEREKMAGKDRVLGSSVVMVGNMGAIFSYGSG